MQRREFLRDCFLVLPAAVVGCAVFGPGPVKAEAEASDPVRLERMAEYRNQVNPQANILLRNIEARYGMTSHPSWDVAAPDPDSTEYLRFMYQNLMYYAQNPANGSSDCRNSGDLAVHYGQRGAFQELSQFQNSVPIIEVQQGVVEYPNSLNRGRISALWTTLFNNHRLDLNKVIFTNHLATDCVAGYSAFDITQPPLRLKMEEWLHEMAHAGLPMAKRVYLPDDQNKFITAGQAFPRVIQYYTQALSTFNGQLPFVEERFFSHPQDTTKGMIENEGGTGLIKAMEEWVPMLIAQTLMHEQAFEGFPQPIQSLVLTGLNYIKNGDNTDPDYDYSGMQTLRGQVLAARPAEHNVWLSSIFGGDVTH